MLKSTALAGDGPLLSVTRRCQKIWDWVSRQQIQNRDWKKRRFGSRLTVMGLCQYSIDLIDHLLRGRQFASR
jgi:hypothetical protein